MKAIGSAGGERSDGNPDRRAEQPSAEALVERARAMIPALKDRSKQAIADRKVPDETIAEMQAAGFFRVLQPKRWGGYEMHPNVSSTC